ncbi:hypothetical protein DL95DRAFT_398804 [Leptodontidium sp. 2 PMI_412]|nr:hypothetical protein DL95DRAFT_398804 [Leptodontidium sp. 2 PMI_412]
MRSATFGRSGDKERVVDLDGADHSTVCRFGDEDQDQYNLKKVKSNILNLYTKSKVKPLSEQDLKLLQLPPGAFLQVIRSRDNLAQMTVDQAGKQTAANMSSVMLAQTAIHSELALALGLGAGLSYAGSFLGPLVLTGVATLSTGALVLTYRHAVSQNDTQLNTSLPMVAQASTQMHMQLIEAHQRTILLNQYEELEQAQQKLKEEREEWHRARFEAEEAHEAVLHEILQKTVDNSEQLASIRRNRAEATAVTSAQGGWLPLAILKAAKTFVAYLTRWIGVASAD